MLVNLHDCCLVTASVAVVGGRENGDDVAVLRPVVTLHDQLMGSRNERESVILVEGLRNVLAKSVASAAGRYSPSAAVVGV